MPKRSSESSPLDQAYWYVPEGDTSISIAPFGKSHDVLAVISPVIIRGIVLSLTIMLDDAVQPNASVTVTLYVPASIFVKSSELPPLDQSYSNGAVPVFIVKLTEPLDCPQVDETADRLIPGVIIASATL